MNTLITYLAQFPPELATALLAMLPVTELRFALPFALTVLGLEPWVAYLSAVLGNFVPIVLIWLLLPPIVAFAKHHSPWLDRVLTNYFWSLEQKHKARFQYYGSLALLLFVAIPLPGSGAWTGSLVAILFRLKPTQAIPATMIGVAVAGILILLITQGALGALSFLL